MPNITNLDQIPYGNSFIIITNKSLFIPGDRRSRETPGHGYPEHHENYVSIEIFETEEEWREKITELLSSTFKDSFKACKMNVVKVGITAVIEDTSFKDR